MTVTRQALNAAIQKPIVNETFTPEFVRFLQSLISDRKINTGTAQPVTVASGVISALPNYSYYSVSVESGSSDDVDTVGNLNEGDMVFFKAADATKTVVFKDGTGNIKTDGSADLSLDNSEDLVLGHFDGTSLKCSLWNIGA